MRVLLLEDHPELCKLIGEHLIECGFAVDAVQCGADAVEASRTASYDAVVLDLGLPDMDGLEVLRRLRQRLDGSLPAVIVTARDAIDDRIQGLNAGADDYIVKPFDLAELVARLRAVLRRPGQRQEAELTLGRLSFDSTSRACAVDGHALELSRRETTLLEELMLSKGKVVTRDRLEEHLYSFNEPVTPNALEAVVSRLRRKLSVADAEVMIETIRGIGYRFCQSERS